MTYAARFKAVGAETFRAVTAGSGDANGRMQVSTAVVRADQPDVALEYLLQNKTRRAGASSISSPTASAISRLKRAEYQRVFASGGIEGLIAELEQQTERLARD